MPELLRLRVPPTAVRLGLALGVSVLLAAAVFYWLGGSVYLEQPGPWIGWFVVVALTVTCWVLLRVGREVVALALPLFVGGWLGLGAGFWDPMAWALSPPVLSGAGLTIAIGIARVRFQGLRPRSIIFACALALLAFGLSLLVVFIVITLAAFA